MVESLLFLIVIAGIGVLIFLISKVGEKLNQQGQINTQQSLEIQKMKEELLMGSEVQKVLKNGVEKTRESLDYLTKEGEFRKQREFENIERIKRLDSIIAGTHSKGLSGENILQEIFKQFPEDMIVTNKAADEVLSIPVYPQLTEDMQKRVVEEIAKIIN